MAGEDAGGEGRRCDLGQMKGYARGVLSLWCVWGRSCMNLTGL